VGEGGAGEGVIVGGSIDGGGCLWGSPPGEFVVLVGGPWEREVWWVVERMKGNGEG